MTALELDGGPVLAAGDWSTNADLIADVHRLGYLNDDDVVLDPTYGLGRFWQRWRPPFLMACDLNIDRSPMVQSVDFTDLPFDDREFDAVVFDPPYKLNGTPSGKMDEDYGVDEVTRWQDRHTLIRRGIAEAFRVLKPGGHLLVKCQDQVCSGAVRWQTREFADYAESLGLRLVDRFDIESYRPQPDGRRQVHARRNTSTLLVFVKPKRITRRRPEHVERWIAEGCVLQSDGGVSEPVDDTAAPSQFDLKRVDL